MSFKPKLTALTALFVLVLLPACSSLSGGDETPSSDTYAAPHVIAIVQGWPLLHANDYECGTATIPERTVISAVARREFLDFATSCDEDDDGTDVTRAVRLATTSEAWTAVPDGDGGWTVALDPGTARVYEWTFSENGPQLLATGGAALIVPLFNWASPAAQP